METFETIIDDEKHEQYSAELIERTKEIYDTYWS